MTDEELEKLGANAMAQGRSYLDNPYYQSETLPRQSGDTVDEWYRKLNVWHRGWLLEDLIRSRS